jgi:hypothetical protein
MSLTFQAGDINILFLTTKIKNKAIISGLEIFSLSLFFSSPEKLKSSPHLELLTV